MSFFGVLTILFIGLKLTNYIDWSWWLVLLPAYGGVALFGGLSLIMFILAAFAGAKVRITRRK